MARMKRAMTMLGGFGCVGLLKRGGVKRAARAVAAAQRRASGARPVMVDGGMAGGQPGRRILRRVTARKRAFWIAGTSPAMTCWGEAGGRSGFCGGWGPPHLPFGRSRLEKVHRTFSFADAKRLSPLSPEGRGEDGFCGGWRCRPFAFAPGVRGSKRSPGPFRSLARTASHPQSLKTRRAVPERKASVCAASRPRSARRARHFPGESMGQLVPNMTRPAPTVFM